MMDSKDDSGSASKRSNDSRADSWPDSSGYLPTVSSQSSKDDEATSSYSGAKTRSPSKSDKFMGALEIQKSPASAEASSSRPPAAVVVPNTPPGPVAPVAEPALETIENQPLPVRKTLSNWKLVILGIHFSCGLALLSIPFAVMEGGWHGLTLFLFFASASLYTSHLLGVCFTTHPDISSYDQLGFRAFGVKGRIVAWGVVFIYNFASCVEFSRMERILVRHALPKDFFIDETWTVRVWLCLMLASIMMLVVLFHRSDASDPYTAAIAVSISVVVVVCLLYDSYIKSSINQETPNQKILHIHTLALAIGFFGFSFSGHVFYPELHSKLHDQTQYFKIIVLSFLPSLIMYLITAWTGYATYGDEVKPVFIMSMQRNSVAYLIAVSLLLIQQPIRFVICVSGIATSIDELVKPGRWGYFMTRFVLVTAAIGISFFLAPSGLIMSFLGCLLAVVVALIIPCACFLRIRWGQFSLIQGIVVVIVLVAAVIAAIFGIFRSLSHMDVMQFNHSD